MVRDKRACTYDPDGGIACTGGERWRRSCEVRTREDALVASEQVRDEGDAPAPLVPANLMCLASILLHLSWQASC